MFYEKKTNASNLKETEYLNVSQPKRHHRGIKIVFPEFRWIGPSISETALPNNKYLLGKVGTDKSRALHRTRLRQFKPQQTMPDVQVRTRECKPDPEAIIKLDDLQPRAWECELKKSIFKTIIKMHLNPTHPNLVQDLIYQPTEPFAHQEPHKKPSSEILP